jgi:hypothetical protein|nr:MAG TPA: hypothetical protein [Caudoviricetes sp.]
MGRYEDLKLEITKGFVLAEVQARYVCRSNDKQEVPRPWEYYPELFKEEKRWHEDQDQIREIEACKEARRVYASEFNRRRQE